MCTETGKMLPQPPSLDSSVEPGDRSLTVSFTPLGQDVSYYVVRARLGNHQVKTITSPCTITGLTNGEKYLVSIRAVSNIGMGSWSKESDDICGIPGTYKTP